MNGTAKPSYFVFSKFLKRFTSYAQSISTLAALLSLFAGPLLIAAFMGKVSAYQGFVPISGLDLYSAALLPIVALLTVFLACYGAFLVVFNAFMRDWMTHWLRIGFPQTLSRWRDERRKRLPRSLSPRELRNHMQKSAVEYLVLHAPALLMIVSACMVPSSLPAALLAFCIGVFVTHFSILTRAPEVEGTVRIKRFHKINSQIRKTTGATICINAAAVLVWVIAFWFFSQIYSATYGTANSVSDYDVYIAIAFVVLFDFMFFSRNRSALGALAGIAVMFFAALLVFQPSMIGVASFRALGIGGGMPASMLVRTTSDDGKPQFIVKRGCLVANAGNQIVLEELVRNSESTEHLAEKCRPRHWFIMETKEERQKESCDIAVYARGDVAVISGIEAKYNLKNKKEVVRGCEL